MLFAYRTAAHTCTGISPLNWCLVALLTCQNYHPWLLLTLVLTNVNYVPSWHNSKTWWALLRHRQVLDRKRPLIGIPIPIPYNQETQCGYLFQQQGSWAHGGKGGGWYCLRKGPQHIPSITDGHRRKVVHINRLQRRIQPSMPEANLTPVRMSLWQPPSVNHDEIPVGETTPQPCYPQHIRRPQIVCSLGWAESQGGRM